jgi:hypothetical protein
MTRGDEWMNDFWQSNVTVRRVDHVTRIALKLKSTTSQTAYYGRVRPPHSERSEWIFFWRKRIDFRKKSAQIAQSAVAERTLYENSNAVFML